MAGTARVAGARSLHTELYGFTTELIGRACLSPAACGEQSPPSLLPAPVSGGEPDGAQKSVPQKTEETREMALGGAEERQDVQKNPEEGREARSAASNVQTPRN